MSFLNILPLAVVMVAGPQILSAIFFATSQNWRRLSVMYVVGAGLSITAIVTLAYFFIDGALGQNGFGSTLDLVIVGLLLVAMASTYLNREESEPPKWMGKLQHASPRFSFRLGFLLLGFFPSDIITSVTVGSYLANHDSPWTDALPFIFLTLLLLALPALTVLAFGNRAAATLPKIRDWMNTNSWIVSEVVLAFFVFIVLSG